VIVISNTSPIVNLATVGQLELLHQLYGQVIIPPAVFREIAVSGAGQPGAADIEAFDWIETLAVKDRAMVTSLQLEVDEGEAEAIVLAVELNADLLLIDERIGRAVASRLGLNFIGLLGLLIEAKRKGLVFAVKPILDDLIGRSGYWITRELYDSVLNAAGE
jgi:predicted nucleic acid-binding protein